MPSRPQATMALAGAAAALAVGLSACNSTPEASGLNAARPAPTGADPPGSRWSAWSAPRNLGPVVNSAGNEEHPSVSRDNLSLYFVSDRPGGLGRRDIWVSRRTSHRAPWGPPVNLGPNINSAADERSPTLSDDGRRLYFSSLGRGGCGLADLFVAARDTRDDLGWRPAENLGCDVNSRFGDAGPALFEDRASGATTMYFASSRPGGPGGFDIYQSQRRAGESRFGPATLVPELSGPYRDTRTAVSRDGLEIILSSDVEGRQGGVGGQDLWVSSRRTTRDRWSVPVNLGRPINSQGYDGAPALSFDGSTLYFHSDRPGGFGGTDLYVSTRSRR
jgi:Tol biopolymer transport system component